MKKIVNILESLDNRKHKKTWRKLVTNVDQEKRDGYAFEGVFN